MFGKVCDTVGCKGKPVARVRRRWYLKLPDRSAKVMDTDRELCEAPGCLEHAIDQFYEPETMYASIDRLPEEAP